MTFKVTHYASYAETPASYQAFFERAKILGFFYSESWIAHLMDFIFPEDNQFRLYAVEDTSTGQPLLVAPMRFTCDDRAAKGANTLAAISHPENQAPLCLIFDESARNPEILLTKLFSYLRKNNHRTHPTHFDALRLWPLDPDSELTDRIFTALNHAGYRVQAYANSFNYYEEVSDLSFDQYLAKRSSKFRYNNRRKERELREKHAMRIELFDSQENIDAAIEDYITISKKSWKTSTSMFSEDVLSLIRRTANEGCLRLGIMYADGKPVAAQFWVASGGLGNSCRIAYDEDYKKLAVGKVLTQHMIAHILDNDDVDEIDYGYGSEKYKKDWMDSERYYIGFMAFNPDTRSGRFYAFKNIYGSLIKHRFQSMIKRLLFWRKSDSDE